MPTAAESASDPLPGLGLAHPVPCRAANPWHDHSLRPALCCEALCHPIIIKGESRDHSPIRQLQASRTCTLASSLYEIGTSTCALLSQLIARYGVPSMQEAVDGRTAMTNLYSHHHQATGWKWLQCSTLYLLVHTRTGREWLYRYMRPSPPVGNPRQRVSVFGWSATRASARTPG